MPSTTGRRVVEYLTNKSGGAVAAGDVVIIDTSNNEAFTTTTTAGYTGMVGVAQEAIANNAAGRVLTAGYAALVTPNASVTRGDFGKTHTVAKQATDAGASRASGAFCQFLTGGTTPSAHLFGIVDATTGSSSGVPAGTSFPGSPATNDLYHRTDLGILYFYDGTRWVSMQVFKSQMIPNQGKTTTTVVGDLTATVAATAAAITRCMAPSNLGGSDIYLLRHRTVFQVNGGATALGASHKWVGTVVGADTSSGSTGTVATPTIDSGSSGVVREINTTINAVQAAGTLFYLTNWTKTGTPGTLWLGEELYYRVIAT